MHVHLGVRIIPSVGIMKTQSIRIQNQPGTHLVMFRPNDNNIRIRRNLDGRYLQAAVDNSDAVKEYFGGKAVENTRFLSMILIR